MAIVYNHNRWQNNRLKQWALIYSTTMQKMGETVIQNPTYNLEKVDIFELLNTLTWWKALYFRD